MTGIVYRFAISFALILLTLKQKEVDQIIAGWWLLSIPWSVIQPFIWEPYIKVVNDSETNNGK